VRRVAVSRRIAERCPLRVFDEPGLHGADDEAGADQPTRRVVPGADGGDLGSARESESAPRKQKQAGRKQWTHDDEA
jgi:hypothetical protein